MDSQLLTSLGVTESPDSTNRLLPHGLVSALMLGWGLALGHRARGLRWQRYAARTGTRYAPMGGGYWPNETLPLPGEPRVYPQSDYVDRSERRVKNNLLLNLLGQGLGVGAHIGLAMRPRDADADAELLPPPWEEGVPPGMTMTPSGPRTMPEYAWRKPW